MNQINIGKFIAQCRKEKGITQEQLASMLNTTNKSVSKWENGNCLPDSSLYEPLCKILNISINELFAGERLVDDSNNNLMEMLKYKLYCLSDKNITFEQFSMALDRISEVTTILKSFPSKEEAVKFLMNETSTSYEECEKAYDFYIQLFTINES
ncbi:MAG: helix-turn-helix transcriptional regulator [Erysipelotrichaceae bacterium]|nr:helix-turn-helix transcriptional regulator [Erysipelotrichaceae bacterium]